jgi:hypothetical protein
MHLKCNRGPFPSCLDWTEICDGKVDCLDGEYDEEHCWQLETHQYNEDEYQNSNGQCIPEAFLRYDINIPDCLYYSDKTFQYNPSSPNVSGWMEPSFRYEDVGCAERRNNFRVSLLISSCVVERENLLLNAIFSIKPKLLSNECWTAMKCIMHMPILLDKLCRNLCSDKSCDKIIQMSCPDIVIVPAAPVLFGHIYLAYQKNKSIYRSFSPASPQYPCYNYQLLHLPIDNQSLLFFNNTACGSPPGSHYLSVLQKGMDWTVFIKVTFLSLNRFQSSVSSDHAICNSSNIYQCINSSKCISKNRLYDRVIHCLHGDDEKNLLDKHSRETMLVIKNCSTIPNRNYFQCIGTNECIRRNLVRDGRCHCITYDDTRKCDDEDFEIQFHFKLFVMVSLIYHHQNLSNMKMKQTKQIVNNGHLFISIIVVMVSGILSMV